MAFSFYGLLYLSPDETSTVNLRAGYEDRIAIYFANAVTLARSLQQAGFAFTLLTNAPEALEQQRGERALAIAAIPFTRDVPPGLPFYSAHFKLDVIAYLARSRESYVALCDLDAVCINPAPAALAAIAAAKLPLFYDISDQVIPAYGRDAIVRDLSLLGGIESAGRWAGGEFLAGSPAFFGQLDDAVREVWPIYRANTARLHHIGDEAVLSAALERLLREGVAIGDAGTLGLVGRFWSGPIQHRQRALAHYRDHFILHLPADKRFLAGLAIVPGHTDVFVRYAAYLRRRRLVTALKRMTKALR